MVHTGMGAKSKQEGRSREAENLLVKEVDVRPVFNGGRVDQTTLLLGTIP